jgi:hypothetical protein
MGDFLGLPDMQVPLRIINGFRKFDLPVIFQLQTPL